MTTLAQMIQTLNSSKTRPPIVVYCGSTSRCHRQFQRAQLYDTVRPEPRMFFTIGCSLLSDAELLQSGVELDKDALDALHFWKILTAAQVADATSTTSEVCVLDLTDDGDIYIGSSTRRELDYAHHLINKGFNLKIRFWSREQDEVNQVVSGGIIDASM